MYTKNQINQIDMTILPKDGIHLVVLFELLDGHYLPALP